ncbi:hypothetical protein, partial [Roseivivax isoporae]|uniref:hypothetical protein n=1 Tax=Roseivivax isoporae TaxID=591206 RepID=UPI001B7FD063
DETGARPCCILDSGKFSIDMEANNEIKSSMRELLRLHAAHVEKINPPGLSRFSNIPIGGM